MIDTLQMCYAVKIFLASWPERKWPKVRKIKHIQIPSFQSTEVKLISD